VTARMRALGITGIDVDRPTALLIADVDGVKDLPPESEWTPQLFSKRIRSVPEAERKDAARRFDADPRDTATPEAMAKLLLRIQHRDLLKPDSAELLLDIMRRCHSGAARIKGILPAGTEVAHKTGTIGMSVDDVGIITLPDNAGHVVLAAFVKSSVKESAARE